MSKFGFTTGSCAAAAAKAAAYMLLTGRQKENITIETPKGILFHAEILDIKRTESNVSCAVKKDGGDDPDVTTGALIYASVGVRAGESKIYIDGGTGVGRVTKQGLDQPVGNAAINHVPREMIEKEVSEVCEFMDYRGSLEVVISVPEGERLAEKTFNGRLGITGGISILGTSGIVEPMSRQALVDTIKVELKQKRAEGNKIVAVSPGNYGLDYMKRAYGYDLDRSVKCSNFIGETIDMAVELGFEKMLLTGHIGKLIKTAGGIMNTHSREGDCRMELLAAACIREKVPVSVIEQILFCSTTEAAVALLEECGKKEAVMKNILEKVTYYLNKRAAGKMRVEIIIYSNESGELAKTAGAEEMIQKI